MLISCRTRIVRLPSLGLRGSPHVPSGQRSHEGHFPTADAKPGSCSVPDMKSQKEKPFLASCAAPSSIRCPVSWDLGYPLHRRFRSLGPQAPLRSSWREAENRVVFFPSRSLDQPGETVRAPQRADKAHGVCLPPTSPATPSAGPPPIGVCEHPPHCSTSPGCLRSGERRPAPCWYCRGLDALQSAHHRWLSVRLPTYLSTCVSLHHLLPNCLPSSSSPPNSSSPLLSASDQGGTLI